MKPPKIVINWIHISVFILFLSTASAKAYEKMPEKIPEKYEAPPTYPVRSLERRCLNLDFLFFKPIEDGLKYAETQTTNDFIVSPPSPPSRSIGQPFTYAPGVRIGAEFYLFDKWELEGIWTCLYHTPPSITVEDINANLCPGLSIPAFAAFPNSDAFSASGGWKLKMNVVNLELKRPFVPENSLCITPLFGVQGCYIQQNMHASYSILNVSANNTTAQKINGKSTVWGVGPEIGSELRMVMPRKWTLLLRGAVSYMAGKFDVTNRYSDLINVPSTSLVVLKEAEYRLFSAVQLQGSLSKWWQMSKCSTLELVAGWETQLWSRQQRFNWFSSIVLAPNGADLSLWGPFGRVSVAF